MPGSVLARRSEGPGGRFRVSLAGVGVVVAIHEIVRESVPGRKLRYRIEPLGWTSAHRGERMSTGEESSDHEP